jgi:hypothetical protein
VGKYLLIVSDEDSYGDPTSVILGNSGFLFACGAYALLTVGLLYSGLFIN